MQCGGQPLAQGNTQYKLPPAEKQGPHRASWGQGLGPRSTKWATGAGAHREAAWGPRAQTQLAPLLHIDTCCARRLAHFSVVLQ